MTTRSDTPDSTGISRRTLAKGAAWAVPAVLLAAPAPAFATSLRKDPGINGWVRNTPQSLGNCSYNLTVRSNLPGTGNDGAPFGLYLYDAQPTDTITEAKLTYWIIGNQQATVTAQSGHSSCWSSAVRGAPQAKRDGLTYTPYTFTYNCPIDPSVVTTQPDGVERVWLGHFHVNFNFTQPSNRCRNVTYWTQRSIKIDIHDGTGPQTLTFERRNGTLGPYTGGMRRQAVPEVEAELESAELRGRRVRPAGLRQLIGDGLPTDARIRRP